jgi:alpha-L-fucosidase
VKSIIFAIVVSLSLVSRAAHAQDERLKWFNDARYGMFIHWGLYAVPAGEWEGKTNYGEWIQLQAKLACATYDALAKQFNPTKFDAKQWARIAKEAGMKYVVITAKHHDGFSMYDTKLSEFDIVDATPYAKDPMKELADAVRAEGLTFCFYYSIPDWHHPEFPAKYSQRATKEGKPGFHGNPKDDADIEKYNQFMKGQVRELLTNYGPIGILWFDGGGSFMKDDPLRAKVIHAQEIIDMIRQLQPNCLVNNRLGLPADYGTPEQHIPGEAPKTAFEVCMTLNKHWGYNKADDNWKQPKEVIRNLADIASKGGNYLLNVGPTAEGLIPDESVKILGEVGKWMKTNGEAIYGTSASPFATVPAWGRATRKGKMVYLHVFDWPKDGNLALPGLSPAPKAAYLLSDSNRKPLPVLRGEVAAITVPKDPPDSNNSVIAVEIE